MKNWKTKLFGDNSLNFYGWLVAGLFVIGASGYFVKRILDTDQYFRSSEGAMLLAIWLMLLGLFGIAWHNYLARVAEKLDAPKDKKTDDNAA